jgi:hypothetical protein
MMATTTVSPAPAQSEASKILGLLFVIGLKAATMFATKTGHAGTAQTILTALEAALPQVEGLL